MTDPTQPSVHEEYAGLVAGVSAHLRRLERRGQRKLASPRGSSPAPVAPALATDRPRTPSIATRAATPAPPAVAERPAGAPSLLKDASTSEAPRRTAQLALEAAVLQAGEIRARAQACPDLASLRAAVAGCTACSLCRTRTQTVFMDGDGRVPVMFVGEAPGANEDEQGLPFVGRAGALLNDIITKGMGLQRKDVAIANVLKCRPPENRDPTDVEKILCTPWLDRQLELVDPKVVIPLGGHAAKHLLQANGPLGALRGRVHERQGRKVIPTFHPAYLLRSPGEKGECWKDIQLAMAELGLERRAPNRPLAGNSSEPTG